MTLECKIKLNVSLVNQDGDELIQSEKLRNIPQLAKLNEDEFNFFIKTTSREKLLELAPRFTLGDGIKMLLINIQPKDIEQSSQIFSILISLNNKILTAKGEWTRNIDELKKLIELVKESKNMSPLVGGQVFGILELELANLVSKNNK